MIYQLCEQDDKVKAEIFAAQAKANGSGDVNLMHVGGEEQMPPRLCRTAPNGTQRPRAIRLDGIKILLVDDSPDNQKLFQRILVAAGALVDLAGNGAIAVGLQAEKTYDVIIMDIRMPVLDGYQATSRIRERGFGGPIIALTAHANPGEEERCRAAGCSHFYLKPIDRVSLLRAVELASTATL